MASLASKDIYFQKLASKVCVSHDQYPRKTAFVPFHNGGEKAPAKKRKDKQARTDDKTNVTDKPLLIKRRERREEAPGRNPDAGSSDETHGGKAISKDFSAVGLLRQRLHEKIEESRGQGNQKGLSSEAAEKKRERRKQERERKKRKRKEFWMKKLAEKAGDVKTEDPVKPEDTSAAASNAPKNDNTAIVFNKVEVSSEYMSKAQLKKEKKQKVKGNLTPLTGKNYKQLLSRVEARKAKLEELRGKDQAKAEKMEEKMKWTNVLYKAEGLKIKDNEEQLSASLKKKEKMRALRKKRWDQRSLSLLDKMQHRQDKRRKNIQKRKSAKLEKRKEKARKKGRILPEDLEKAN